MQLARGFEVLLDRIDDLTFDNPQAPHRRTPPRLLAALRRTPSPPSPSHPQAPHLLAALLVRAVSDDLLLPPAFVRLPPPEALATAKQLDTLTQARAQLDATHFSGHRAKVWGPAANVSLPTLKEAVTELAREYWRKTKRRVICAWVRLVRCSVFVHYTHKVKTAVERQREPFISLVPSDAESASAARDVPSCEA